MFWLLGVIIVALVVGVLARAILPGKDDIGCLGTIVLGWVGSLAGGVLGNLIGGGSVFSFERAGIIGSIIGAMVVLLVYRIVSRGKGKA